jgi:hypothetical protein
MHVQEDTTGMAFKTSVCVSVSVCVFARESAGTHVKHINY